MGEAALKLDEAPAIGVPSGLEIPDPTRFSAVMSNLSESGQSLFVSEIMESLADAKRHNDLRPVQTVVDAWWHTFQFASHPRIKESIAEAAMAPGQSEQRRYTAEEVAEYVGA